MGPAAVEHSVQLGSERVRVRVQGQGDGPPVLFLNGLAAPLELWDPLLRRMSDTCSIAFDTPGSGGSGPPHLPLSIGGHARLALALVDYLGYGEVDMVGLSFGGMVAQELAHLAPRRVGRLVLASTSCGWGSVPGSPAALLAMTTPERYYSRAVFETVPAEDVSQTAVERGLVRQEPRGRATNPPSARGFMYQFWAAAFWSSLYWLPELCQPTLVLAGSEDELVPPSNADMLARLLPHARKHIVRGGGHLCLLEHAGKLAPMIENFLHRRGVVPGRLPPENPRARAG